MTENRIFIPVCVCNEGDIKQKIDPENYEYMCMENICDSDLECKDMFLDKNTTLPICSTEGKCIEECQTDLDCDGYSLTSADKTSSSNIAVWITASNITVKNWVSVVCIW